MIINITGARLSNRNKGAQLMLATVCERLRSAAPNVTLTIPLDFQDRHSDRYQYDLRYAVHSPSRLVSRNLCRDLFAMLASHSGLHRPLGLVPESELDGVLDISGYAFGDKWPVWKAKRLAKIAATCKRRGKPVILLPQMLGPFTKPDQAAAFKELSRHCDLIFAREQESYDCARTLVADDSKLRICPDITITTSAKQAPIPSRDYACLVVNSKLLEPNPQQQHWADTYIQRLTDAGRHLLAKGLDVVVVEHEYTPRDRQLAQQVRQTINGDCCTIFSDPDPQVLKGFLGGSQLLIGSRFHSLVSTLSMGVPAIALGWAHKYDALLRDFGTLDFVHFADHKPEHLLECIDNVLDHRGEISKTIDNCKQLMAPMIEAMWLEVCSVMRISTAEGFATPWHDRPRVATSTCSPDSNNVRSTL